MFEGQAWLGPNVDPEATQPYSADATGDDGSGDPASGGPADEDAITVKGTVEVVPGGTMPLAVTCTGTGTGTDVIAGCIDWNLNDVFDDASERSTSSPACPAGSQQSVTLSFAVPGNMLDSGGFVKTFVRIRITPTAAELTPVGISTKGEAEDYRLVAGARARVVLQTTTLGGTGGPWGFLLTNTTKTSGTAATATAGIAIQVDGDTVTADTQPYLVSTTSAAVTINESSILAGWALASVTCGEVGPDSTKNVGTLSGTTFTIGRLDADPPDTSTGPGSIVTCDFINDRPKLTLVKKMDNSFADSPQLAAKDWTLTATSRGDGSVTVSGAGPTTVETAVIKDAKFDLAETSTAAQPTGYTAGNWSCAPTTSGDDGIVALSVAGLTLIAAGVVLAFLARRRKQTA